MSERHLFRTLSRSQHVNGFQTLLKSACSTFIQLLHHSWRLSLKTSLLVITEILGLPVTSILVIKEKISLKQSKSNQLRNYLNYFAIILTLFYLGYLGQHILFGGGGGGDKNALALYFLNQKWYDNETWHTLRPYYAK